MNTIQVENAGTVYRIHVVTLPLHDQLFMCETGWGSGFGQWVRLDVNKIAWTYLTEKMPALAKYPGDKPGWFMAFAKAGVEVF